MAITVTSVTYINPDFDSGGSTPVNYLRGHISENISIVINFETTNLFNEVNLFTNFISNSTTLYPDGTTNMPTSHFNSLSTGDVQSFRGVAGTLTPNNIIRWREGSVLFAYVGAGGIGQQYTLTITTKITPLILENQLTVLGIPAVGLVDYLAASESLKHVFKIECFTNAGDTTPAETTDSIDLSSIIVNGNVGFFNEFLNGNAPNHELQYINRSGDTWTGRIKNNVGAWAVTDKVILKTFRVIEGSFNDVYNLDENHYFNELNALADGVNVSDSLITDLDCTINGTDNTVLDITFTIDNRFFVNRGRYIFIANCGTPTASEATNKRTAVRLAQFKNIFEVDENLLQFAPIGLGLSKVVFNYHESDDLANSFDNIAGYSEDIIVGSATLRIPRGTTDRDNINLTNLNIAIVSDEQPILEERNFLVSDNTIQSYNRGYELLSSDFRNTITFENTLIESRNNFGAIYIPDLFTLRRFDGGSFITDGFTVGSALTITGDIAQVTTIAGVTDGDITIVDPLDIQYLNEHWDITLNGTDYFNVVRSTGDLNYKEYTFKFPFKLTWRSSPVNIEMVNLTNLKFKLTATIQQAFWNKTNVIQDFTYSVDDFTVYDYAENNPNDTTITGVIETFDESEVTNQNEFLTSDAINLVRARFTQSGLHNLLSRINGIIRLGNNDSLSQFFIRDHSSLRANKDNEFTNALTTVTTPGADNIDIKAFIDGSLLDSLNYKLSSRIDLLERSFAFFTNFDPLGGGTFDPSTSGAGSGHLWTFEDGSTIAGQTVSTTGNGLDGTTQLVILTADDISIIPNILINNDDLIGTLNLSSFNGGTSASPNFNIYDNIQVTKVIFPSRPVNLVGSYIRCYNMGVTEFDFTPFGTEFGGRVQGFSCTSLTTIINPTSTSNTFNTIDFNGCTSLGSGPLIDYSGFTNILEGTSFSMRFDNCNLTEAQVDKILIDVDNNSTNGFAGRSINLGGSNAAPSAAGVTAKNSLITKTFTVTTN